MFERLFPKFKQDDFKYVLLQSDIFFWLIDDIFETGPESGCWPCGVKLGCIAKTQKS